MTKKGGLPSLMLRHVCGEAPPTVYEHAYTITPTNFLILPEEKQKRRLADFFDLLRMLQNTATITLEKVPITVRMGGGRSTDGARDAAKDGSAEGSQGVTEREMEIVRVLLDSTDSLDDTLERLGFSYTIDEAPRQALTVTSEGMRDFKCEVNGAPLFGRAYSVCGAPSVLPPAWVHNVFRTFHRVQIHVTPIRPDDAMRKMQNRELLYSGVRTSRADMQKKLEDIRTLKRSLELGNTSAYTFIVNGFVFARTRKELLELGEKAKRNVAAMNVRVTAGLGLQRNLAKGPGTGASWLGSIDSMHILYPFASSDMLEAPNGILLGRNQHTNGPVIYDVNQRKNHNIFTCGQPGSGKSFTNKIILKRFLENRPHTPCTVIDPQGEYLPHAEYFGLDTIEVEAGKQFGLDPFALFDKPVEAADLLGSATGAPEVVRKEWRSICDSVKSIEELHEKSSSAAKWYLADLVKGSVSEVFRGKPRFSDHMIISLKKTENQEYEGLLIMLVLAYAWRRVNELPDRLWKIILLDEAWRVTKMQQSTQKIGEMSREGRKRSLILAISTQQFSDMDRALADESKLTELFDTKIIMQMPQSAARLAGRALDLTDREVESIVNFRPGYGMMQTSDNAIYLKFEATAEETSNYFNTSAVKDDRAEAAGDAGAEAGGKVDTNPGSTDASAEAVAEEKEAAA